MTDVRALRRQCAGNRQPANVVALGATNHRVVGVREPDGTIHDRLHDRLQVARRTADDPKDLRRGRLLFLRLRFPLRRFSFVPQCLCQALLEVADPGVFVLG